MMQGDGPESITWSNGEVWTLSRRALAKSTIVTRRLMGIFVIDGPEMMSQGDVVKLFNGRCGKIVDLYPSDRPGFVKVSRRSVDNGDSDTRSVEELWPREHMRRKDNSLLASGATEAAGFEIGDAVKNKITGAVGMIEGFVNQGVHEELLYLNLRWTRGSAIGCKDCIYSGQVEK